MLDGAKRELDRTIEKRVQEGLATTRDQAKKEGEESLSLNVKEKEQTIPSIQKQIDELKLKAEHYELVISKGFTTLRQNIYSTNLEEPARNFRQPVDEKHLIRGMIFEGCKKCLYPKQKFHSDTERRFSVILENDEKVLKWIKPGREDFQIYYRQEEAYEPDFVVETKTDKYLCEPKRADQMNHEDVLAKAKAARGWCQHATAPEKNHGGKSWSYLLIPHDVITENKTLQGLASVATGGVII